MATATDPLAAEAIELIITRVFEAPRALVWQIWTRPEHLARWHCPKGFAVFLAEADARPEGVWRVGMRSPEGNEYVMSGVYRELDPPERLVTSQFWERNDLEPPVVTEMSVTLREHGGHTEMVFVQSGFGTIGSRNSHEGGWRGAFDNLAAHLAAHLNAN